MILKEEDYSLSSFEPWEGAVSTYNRIYNEGKLDELERYIEDMYPDGCSETDINDLLWFEEEELFDYLNIKDEEEDEEEVDELLDYCYALYKKDWLKQHNLPLECADWEEIDVEDEYGESFVCFEEFTQNEMREEEYLGYLRTLIDEKSAFLREFDNRYITFEGLIEYIIPNNYGWGVEVDDTHITLSKYSPAGQDFSFELEYAERTVGEFLYRLNEWYEGFDVSYETYLWLDNTGHGVNGAPYEMVDVYEDMRTMKTELKDIAHFITNKLKN